MLVVDDEASRIRDEVKIDKTNYIQLKNKQSVLYDFKQKTLDKLYREKLIYTLGYYTQVIDNKVRNKIFVNKVNGIDTEIYSLKKYNKKKSKVANLGEIGLIEPKKLECNLTLQESIDMLNNYIYTSRITDSKPIVKTKASPKPSPIINKKKPHSKTEEVNYKIKETKLVEFSRLRVVRDIHIKAQMNPFLTKHKMDEITEYVDKNNGVYPKHEAMLVRKAKDENDRRKVVYNIEDGYRRFTIAEELGLEKVYVDIIDE